jgi:DNA repair protein RecO (recombination protein O)
LPEQNELRSEALVLRRIDYGEADRIVWLILPGRGRLSAFAAGARKSKRRFCGALEPFTRLTVRLVPPRRGELFRLAETEILESHEALRHSLEALATASAACEIVAALGPEGHHPSHGADLYVPLLGYLRAVVRSGVRPNDFYRFLLLALEAAGLRPKLSRCARCHGAIGQGRLYFDSVEGGFLCERCPPRFAGAVALSDRTAAAMREIETGDGEVSARGPSEAREILLGYAQHHAGRAMKSFAMLRDVGLV